MRSLLQDIRYGLRMSVKNPGFTMIAVLTLALGVGANTAVFSVVNSVLLRPLPLPDSQRLMVLFNTDDPSGQSWAVSYPDFLDWQRENRTFEVLSTFVPQSVNLSGREEPVRVRGGFVSANFFNLAGVQPSLGRSFRTGEDVPGASRVAVINYRMWQSLLGGDPQILGKTLTLNGEIFSIVGVMPKDFRFPVDNCEVWIPAIYNPYFSNDRRKEPVAVVGRLKSSVGRAKAQAEMDTITKQIAQQYPDTNRDRGTKLVPLQNVVTQEIRPAILVLMVAVGFVLLIACANVASLLLARASGRQREMALRATLGAGRARLVRQMVTETLLLWLLGASFGVLLGRWGLDGLARIRPEDSTSWIKLELDAAVLLFSLGVTILTGLVFGLIPAIRFSNPNPMGALKEGSRTAGRGAAHSRAGRVLVASQVALALVLLVGAGLTMRSLAKITGVNPGYNPENLLTLEYRLPRNKYPQKSQQWNFHHQVVERAQALPGVRSAAEVEGLPMSGNVGDTSIVLLDRPEPSPGQELRAQANICDTHFFRTMGIPLLRGRDFTEHDTLDTPHVVAVNQTMAEIYWKGADPIGKVIRLPDEENVTATIVGVVGDVKQVNLDDANGAQLYEAQAQQPTIFATLVARTEGDPMSLATALRSAVWAVDRDQPVWKVRTEQSLLDLSVGPRRFLKLLLEVFSALALLLASIGIYGVISYSTSQRIQEIGVRMALGAQRRDVLRLVLGEGIWIAAIGVAGGCAAALVLTRFLSSQLFGVNAADPLTYSSVALLLAAVAMLACYIPARRAMRVDPLVALRYE
jgi:putative ABC transport system permease protein